LLLAYVATGASVAGGALYYTDILCQQFWHGAPPSLLVLAVVCAIAGYVAYRDVKLSAEMMLWIEVVSVSLILMVLAVSLYRFGFKVDMDQFRLKGVHLSALGPALVLAMFSFVGFESATTLGVEARDPLRTIPRAVVQCALLAGVFFVVCSYAEVLGFSGESSKLSDSTSPLHLLATKAGVSPLGVAIDFGAAVSMFACVLACTTAAARVLMRMAKGGLVPAALARSSKRHGTPGLAISLVAGLMFCGTAVLALGDVAGSDMYDWMGSLSVFGFLTAYALVAAALPFARKNPGSLRRIPYGGSRMVCLTAEKGYCSGGIRLEVGGDSTDKCLGLFTLISRPNRFVPPHVGAILSRHSIPRCLSARKAAIFRWFLWLDAYAEATLWGWFA